MYHIQTTTHTYTCTCTHTNTVRTSLRDSLSHSANPVLEFLVGGVNPEGELECFLSLLLADLSQLTTELVVLIIPSSEHSVALSHHLNVKHYSWYVHVEYTLVE